MKPLIAFLLCGSALFAEMGAPAHAAAVTALIAEKATAEMGAQMPTSGHFNVHLQPGDVQRAEMVSAFWMDQQTGQFAANVVTKDGETLRVYGLAVLEVPVPVPTHRIMPGAILTKADFHELPLPYSQIGTFAETQLDQLVGMQAQRMLETDRPVMIQSISAPIVIDRGQRVSIQYKSGAMSLSAAGRAIAAAAVNQPVRVINLASNKTVTGIARPDGIVEVTP